MLFSCFRRVHAQTQEGCMMQTLDIKKVEEAFAEPYHKVFLETVKECVILNEVKRGKA